MADGFYVPNVQDLPLGFELLARRFHTDDQILGLAAGQKNGIVSGLGVAESLVPGMTVDIENGLGVVDYVETPVIPDSQLIVPGADGSNPRLDIVTFDVAGNLFIRDGVPDTSPVPLVVPDGEVALAMYLVPANETAITNQHIVDKRIFVPAPIAASPWTRVSAAADSTTNLNNNATLAADPVLKFTMAANTKYAIRATVVFSIPASGGGFKIGMDGPAGFAYLNVGGRLRSNLIAASETMIVDTLAYGQLVGTGGTSREQTVNLEGVIHNGSTSGQFALTTAQATAVAVATTRRAGSFLEYAVA